MISMTQSHAASVHSDLVHLWVIERLVSVSLLMLIPVTLILEIYKKIKNKFISHRGLEAIILDYVQLIVVGTIVPKIALFSLYLLSATTLAGVLIYNGPGLSKGVKQGWAIGKERHKVRCGCLHYVLRDFEHDSL